MAYATPADIARVAAQGWEELAQRASHDPSVTGDLLQATYEGGDRSAWPVEAQAAADEALAVVQEQAKRASRHADTYISPRYPSVPLAADLVADTDLPTVVATIALRRMYGTALTEEMRKSMLWADDYLRDLSAGRVSLGSQSAPEGDPETLYDVPSPGFTAEDLRGFA